MKIKNKEDIIAIVMNNKVLAFINSHKMNPQDINPAVCGKAVCEHMLSGLNGKVIDMPMIRTYLTADGDVPKGINAIVIDAGGTNFRSGLATFTDDGCSITNLAVSEMPGKTEPIGWDAFISFLVDRIEPLLDQSELIGFCFSYSAEILPDGDARVITVDKEVKLLDCEGKMIGVSINDELFRRGYREKKIVILNDTVAALFGGSASVDKSAYSTLAGMICGTGFNICLSYKSMLYNTEAGFFNGVPQSDADAAVDAVSLQPGEKLLEKEVSGAYIGPVFTEAVKEAAEDGFLDAGVVERLTKAGIDGSDVDAFSRGIDEHGIFSGEEALAFATDLAGVIFERSARCACSAMIGTMLLTGSGTSAEKPAAFFSEGSLIEKSSFFRMYLEKLLDEFALHQLGLHAVILLGKSTTLPGSAAAVLLN